MSSREEIREREEVRVAMEVDREWEKEDRNLEVSRYDFRKEYLSD